MAMADLPAGGPVESVHSPSASAHISHAVIATYAAAAAREVPGVAAISDGILGGLERRIDDERPPRGLRVSSDGQRVRIDLRLIAEWGVLLPDLAGRVREAVRSHLVAMTELDVGDVAVTIDDVAPPAS
jgi:uncharacterized alkaline shock family protein YloU